MTNEPMASTDIAAPRKSELAWNYFGRTREGFFVDADANHRFKENQTWFLEQPCRHGVLIEPQPDLAALLRNQRPRSKTFQVVICEPKQIGSVDFHLAAGAAQSGVNPAFDVALTGRVMRLPSRTLDSLLAEAGLMHVDFLTVDVGGMELDALDGFDLERWQPRLILIEDSFTITGSMPIFANEVTAWSSERDITIGTFPQTFSSPFLA